MLNFTRKTDYALVALAALALEHGEALRPMSARRIAERYHLPLALLMRVLKDLHRAGLVGSTRGAGGGYHLSTDPGQIHVSAVISAIEGPVRVTVCCDEEAETELCTACQTMSICPISTGMRRLQEVIVSFLERVTIQDLLDIQDTENSDLISIRSLSTLAESATEAGLRTT